MILAAGLMRPLMVLLCTVVILFFTACAEEQAVENNGQVEGTAADEDPPVEGPLKQEPPLEEDEYLYVVDEEEIDDFLVTTTRVDENYLANKGKSLEIPQSVEPGNLQLTAGANSFALVMRVDDSDSYHLYFWDSSSLTLIDKLTFKHPSRPRSSWIKHLQDDYYTYSGNGTTYLVRAEVDGVDQLVSFDLSGHSWDLEEGIIWEHFYPENGEEENWQDEKFRPELINIKLTAVEDYLIAYLDYTLLFEYFSVPSILEEPYFKIFKIEEGELGLITDQVLDEPYFTTDVKALSENMAIIATSDQGFIALDLDDFSYRTLEAGGEHLDVDHDDMIKHAFYETFGEEAFLTRTRSVNPMRHCGMGGDVQLWVASGDSYVLAADTQIGELDMLWEDETFSRVNTKGEYWVEREGLFVLDREKVLSIEDFPGNDYPAISHYYKQDLDLSAIPDEVLSEELGATCLCGLNEQDSFAKYRLALSRGKLIDLEPDLINIFKVEGEVGIPFYYDNFTATHHLSGVDALNEHFYFLTEENIYIMDTDQILADNY